MTYEQYANFKDFLPQEGIEFIWYDQLGSAHSDQPDDSTLWTIERFVDEVEQVRIALGLNKDNFYLYGQSWGGMLAMEYALKHQSNLKGLVISNMMASLDEYEKYAKEVLGPQMPKEVFAEVMEIEKNNDFENFIKSSAGGPCFVRTKGRDSKDVMITANGNNQKKLGYWLSRKYIKNVIAKG